MTDYEPRLEERIEIGAPPDRVWALVSDVCRMAQWSPQVQSTRLAAGQTEVGPGVRFTNANSHGELSWKTHGTVVRFEPNQELAFRIEENWVIWSFRLTPTDRATTVLTQRRETPDGISEFSLRLTDKYLGGQAVFTQTMREGMRETLAKIKAAAEQP